VAALLGFALLVVFAWANKHHFGLSEGIFWIISMLLFFGSAVCLKNLLVKVLYHAKCPRCSRRSLRFINVRVSGAEKLICKECGFEDYTGLTLND
jgi:predicted RNA-binding Zn-ribbon protein involved in translation (DUF1610 family)